MRVLNPSTVCPSAGLPHAPQRSLTAAERRLTAMAVEVAMAATNLVTVAGAAVAMRNQATATAAAIAQVPAQASMLARLAKSILSLCGWRLEAPPPALDQYVLIAAPHTSNWDFPLMILCAMAYRIKIRWLGKKSLFNAPFGWLMRTMGGLPVRRSGGHSQVDVMRQVFAENPQLILAVPPEGTRDLTAHWRSGFYHIAHGANVPIVGSYLDYSQKRAGFGDPLYPTGDVRTDMDVLRKLYAPMRGKHPEKSGAIQLREEMESDTGSP